MNRRDYIIIGVLVLVAIGLIIWLTISRQQYRELTSKAKAMQQEMQQEIDGKPEPMGGAEVAIPETEPMGGAEVPIFIPEPVWGFPIAADDYVALTSPFGIRVSPLLQIEMHHEGVDIASTWRAQVVAVADGIVIEHWPPPDDYWRGHETYGGMVQIRHADGKSSLYAHLSWTRIHTGDQVTRGQVIGRVGNTGKSDGSHLHFEALAPTGKRLNPLLHIEDVK